MPIMRVSNILFCFVFIVKSQEFSQYFGFTAIFNETWSISIFVVLSNNNKNWEKKIEIFQLIFEKCISFVICWICNGILAQLTQGRIVRFMQYKLIASVQHVYPTAQQPAWWRNLWMNFQIRILFQYFSVRVFFSYFVRIILIDLYVSLPFLTRFLNESIVFFLETFRSWVFNLVLYVNNLPPSAPVPKLFSIFAEKFRIDNADSLNSFFFFLKEKKRNRLILPKSKQIDDFVFLSNDSVVVDHQKRKCGTVATTTVVCRLQWSLLI